MGALPSVALGYGVMRYGLAADDAEGMPRHGGDLIRHFDKRCHTRATR